MNVEIVTKAAQFLFWEYLFRIYVIVYLQCRMNMRACLKLPVSLYGLLGLAFQCPLAWL
jgi:hypothetical protein